MKIEIPDYSGSFNNIDREIDRINYRLNLLEGKTLVETDKKNDALSIGYLFGMGIAGADKIDRDIYNINMGYLEWKEAKQCSG